MSPTDDAAEAAVLGILARPAAGAHTASHLSTRLGLPRGEVDKALARLAVRGVVAREVEWVTRSIITSWRYTRGSR